jgi:hypothetical protein
VTKYPQTLVFVFALAFAFAVASTALTSAQEKEKPSAPPPKASPAMPLNVTPLKVQVVIARYQGEKKISSMPYTLTMNASNHANLRMGTKIPVMMVTQVGPAQTPDGKAVPQVGPVQYQDVGTNIDCSSIALEDSRYLLSISVDDSSVYPDEQPAGGVKGNPSFRSFRASNSMVLKNGETGQFTTATDKITGETVKVDVTLTVVK